jgi:hypothetical protein
MNVNFYKTKSSINDENSIEVIVSCDKHITQGGIILEYCIIEIIQAT